MKPQYRPRKIKKGPISPKVEGESDGYRVRANREREGGMCGVWVLTESTAGKNYIG